MIEVILSLKLVVLRPITYVFARKTALKKWVHVVFY